MKPSDMIKIVLNIKRVDIWDASYQWWYGLLKGQQFEALIERHLIVKTFEECSIPLGMALQMMLYKEVGVMYVNVKCLTMIVVYSI